ncbi:hydantoinase B/oxoprolinase family protein [Candidatus Poriferisocius sp.]|uniref:hydantoinase B/oxoprolinase family protein n=1 Tax=Candidatus Poriferisocius sp. TaxID=3101276 RepID=UPI003B02273C
MDGLALTEPGKSPSDPVALEVVKNALAAIAEEMGLTTVRAAYSSVVKEGGDSTAAVFDHRGRFIAQSMGAPLMHLSSLRPSLRSLLDHFPPESMTDGDVYASNDPYRGGIHSNDVMVFRPVFIDDILGFFTCALLHVADLGGMAAGGLPANATEMFQEGLVLPPVPLVVAGQPNQPILDVIAANSRTPEKVLGDIRAMMAATNLGAGRLGDLATRYGLARLHRITGELLDYTERRTRMGIEALPDGTYTGSFVIDDDGVDPTADHEVRVTLVVDGSTITADFAGTSTQAPGPINASVSQTTSGVLFAIRCMLAPDIPVNDGTFRPLELRLPPGTLVNPNPPAALNARMATVMAVAEAMLGAFSQLDPARAVAASCNVHVYIMSGIDSGGQPWAFMDPQFGGSGARSDRDGVDVTGPLVFGSGGAFHTVEAYEQEHPVRFERFELWTDSGGAGRWRGGTGSRRDIRILTDGRFTGRATDRCRRPPPGILGGSPGAGGGWVLNHGTPDEQPLPAKVTAHPLRAGDMITMFTSAGGGYGDPLERDPELVAADVGDNLVSPEAAHRDYGVAINPENGEVDPLATAALRSK